MPQCVTAASALAREIVRGALDPATRTAAFVPRLDDEFDPTGACSEFTVVVRPGPPSLAFPDNSPHATLATLARALVAHRLAGGETTALLAIDAGAGAGALPLDVFVAPAWRAGATVDDEGCLALHGVIVEVKAAPRERDVPRGIFVSRVPAPRWCAVPPKSHPPKAQDDQPPRGPLDHAFATTAAVPVVPAAKEDASPPRSCDECACVFACDVDGRRCFAAVFATRPNTEPGADALFNIVAMDLYRQFHAFHKSAATCVHAFSRPTVLDPDHALATLAASEVDATAL